MRWSSTLRELVLMLGYLDVLGAYHGATLRSRCGPPTEKCVRLTLPPEPAWGTFSLFWIIEFNRGFGPTLTASGSSRSLVLFTCS